MITLRLSALPRGPVDGDAITPDTFAGRSPVEIARLPLGDDGGRLGDLFQVSGSPDDTIRLEGDCSRVTGIGQGMTHGRLEVRGDVGAHAGAAMRGGELIVHGNAGDWAGAEMRDGLLRVQGNAGNLVGAAYRGGEKGMRGGVILVGGRVGDEVGSAMRRGVIAVAGAAGDLTGARMIAGSVFVFGALGVATGAGMKRGTVVAYRIGTAASPDGGGGRAGLLPTFRFDCVFRPAWIGLYLRQLRAWGFPVPARTEGGVYHRYSGDLTELGKGEILAWTAD